MQLRIRYTEIRASNILYWGLLSVLALLVVLGLAAAHRMGVAGHHITGMDNQIVWGLPHVFAIFLIVAASGALNLASLSSVFQREAYKPLARFSALFAIALLIGGLVILLLDLGRPDRLIVAMTYYNFESIFAWNILLYSGFVLIALVYLWVSMERRMHRWVKSAGWLALTWRLILTSGTGLIFGVLIARDTYAGIVLAPYFIVMSLVFGLALSILLLHLSFSLDQRVLSNSQLDRLRSLLGKFVLILTGFAGMLHWVRLFVERSASYEQFILFDGGIYTLLFWLVQVGIGYGLSLVLLYLPAFKSSRTALMWACITVIVGALGQFYVFIIGGQAYPLEIFPGYDVSSRFADGVIGAYAPSLWEWLLGLGGFATALIIALLGFRVLPILPEILAKDPGQATDT